MINIGQETIPKTALGVVWVAGLVGQGVMHMMRNCIDLFRDDLEGKVLRKKPPKLISEFIGPVRTVPMMPDSTVRAHYDHAVNERCNKAANREVFKNKKE